MGNLIPFFLATLTHLGVISKKEAEALNEEMVQATLPDSFEAAFQAVKNIFEKVDIEPKVKK